MPSCMVVTSLPLSCGRCTGWSLPYSQHIPALHPLPDHSALTQLSQALTAMGSPTNTTLCSCCFLSAPCFGTRVRAPQTPLLSSTWILY